MPKQSLLHKIINLTLWQWPQKVDAFLVRVVTDFGAAFGVKLAYMVIR